MYSHQARVTASQIGQDGYQTLVSLINTMQDCSQFSLDHEEAMGEYFKKNKQTLMLASRQVDIARYPAYGEELKVSSWIYECKAAMGYRNTLIEDASGAVVAQSWSVGAVVSFETGKLARLSKEVLKTVQLDQKIDMDYSKRRIQLPEGEAHTFPSFLARPSDIDFNKHVNNVQYVRMASEYLPQDFEPSRMRVEYKNQAKLGVEIVPQVHEAQDGTMFYVKLAGSAGEVFALVEFTDENTKLKA